MKLTFALLLRFLLFATSISIALLIYDGSLFAWHPVCMSIGYILFMADGVLSALSFRGLVGQERVTAIQWHGLMQLRAIVCAIIGFGVIYRNKMIYEKAHFESLHGKIGLAVFILTFVSPLGGLLSFRKMGFIQKFPEAWQPWIKYLHKQIGTWTWLGAMVAIQIALRHKAVDRGPFTLAWQLSCGAITAMMLMIVFQKQSGKQNSSSPLVKSV